MSYIERKIIGCPLAQDWCESLLGLLHTILLKNMLIDD